MIHSPTDTELLSAILIEFNDLTMCLQNSNKNLDKLWGKYNKICTNEKFFLNYFLRARGDL